MIGPQAYEELFLVKHIPSTKGITITHDNICYTYHYNVCWQLFDSHEQFKQWCIEDATERQGEYADKKEMIE